MREPGRARGRWREVTEVEGADWRASRVKTAEATVGVCGVRRQGAGDRR